MKTSLALLPLAAVVTVLCLTGCGPAQSAPTATPMPTSTMTAEPGKLVGGSDSNPSTTPTTAGTPTSTGDRDQAIVALENSPEDWYANLGPDLKDIAYTKASSARLVPPSTIIKARPATWEASVDEDGNPQGKLVADFTYDSGRTEPYNVTMVKIGGKWLVNFTIWNMDDIK